MASVTFFGAAELAGAVPTGGGSSSGSEGVGGVAAAGAAAGAGGSAGSAGDVAAGVDAATDALADMSLRQSVSRGFPRFPFSWDSEFAWQDELLPAPGKPKGGDDDTK